MLAAKQEVADLCQNALDGITEGGFKLERAWSNAAALAGREPCVPVPAGEVYSGASADPATIQLASPGETVTFTLTGPGARSELALAVALDADTIQNGRTATLQVTVPVDARSGSSGYVNLYRRR